MSGILKRKIKHFKERCQKGISLNWFDDNAKLVELSYYKTEGKDKIFLNEIFFSSSCSSNLYNAVLTGLSTSIFYIYLSCHSENI